MKLRLHHEAEAELSEAWRWYDQRSALAADAFALEVDRAFAVVREAPLRWPVNPRGERRFPLHGFPYTVLYRVAGESVFVTAIAHQSRRPGYWKDRK